MRVSIVATALDGHKIESNTVLNMVDRLQNRNTGYSEGLFSQNKNVDSNAINSIEGATALKLDEKFEINEEEQSSIVNNFDQITPEPETELETEINADNIPKGVSMENASYMESNNDNTLLKEDENITSDAEAKYEEEYTPQLFSNENETQTENDLDDPIVEEHSEKLFDQDSNEEEEFEIPAFLRKQKF